jgi:hypothetical protein
MNRAPELARVLAENLPADLVRLARFFGVEEIERLALLDARRIECARDLVRDAPDLLGIGAGHGPVDEAMRTDVAFLDLDARERAEPRRSAERGYRQDAEPDD